MANTVFRNLINDEITLVTTNPKLYQGINDGVINRTIGDNQTTLDNIKFKVVKDWKRYHNNLRERLSGDESIQIIHNLSTFIKPKTKNRKNEN